MNRERWARLKEIVADALEEHSPQARTALLTRACADDETLLREAEAFLKDADTTIAPGTDRLEQCAAVTTAAVRQEELSMTGRRIGAYFVVRKLGHGGMATVYLAVRADGYFEKEVAIKVLKPGGGHSSELMGRFRGEREVLASLEHPNIATLFDAGTTEEGLPYFVMEYVPGTPVTTFVREHKLSVRRRLELFLKICTAVEVAHRRRIVHRDLKRSNILVNEQGEPKLLDFGIAKLLEEHPVAVTALGEQRLTPICASPEQARGEAVTRASDIYALGALLYEILTGKAPHIFPSHSPTLDEVARVVSEEKPQLPSEVAADSETQRALRGDLDAVILHAMEKEPAQRYASVADLAQDIRHYLAGEPVVARPNTLPYRALRFAGRHRPTAGVVVLLALVLFAAFAAGLFLMWRQSQPGAESAATVAEEIPEKSIAVLPFDDFAAPDGTSYFADGVQDDILTDLAKAKELKVISRSGASAYRKGVRDVREIRQNLGVAYVLEGSVRRMDDRVRVNVQLIDTESDVQVWAEQYDRNLDELFALQSDIAQAIIGQLKGNLSAREKAAIETRPTADVKAYDLYLRARESFTQYKYTEALEFLNQAVARDPKFALAYSLMADVDLYLYRFGGDQTPERLAQAKAAADKALELAPDLPEAHLAKAQYFYNGLRDYEKTLAELASAPSSPDTRARFFDLTALAERRVGHWQQALEDGRKAIELDPHDPYIATELIQTYLFLRRYPEAEQLADKAGKLFTVEMAPFWYYKVESILAQGDTARARAALDAAPPNARERNYELARIAMYEHNFELASAQLDAAREKEAPPMQAVDELFRGTIARAVGKAEIATESFNKGRVILEKVLEKDPESVTTVINLAWAYAGLGRKEEALRLSQQAVQLQPTWRDAAEGPGIAAMQAQVRAWVGEKESALDQLLKIAKQPGGPSYGELKLDPGWDDLRTDPRFAEIVAETAKPISFE